MKVLWYSVSGLLLALTAYCALDAAAAPANHRPAGKLPPMSKKAVAAARKNGVRPKRVVQPKGVKGRKAVAGTQLEYDGNAVSLEGGTTLLDFGGQPLRASQIRVWAPRVTWRFALNGQQMTSPVGLGTIAPANYVFPGFNNEGIIISQPNGFAENVTASTRDQAQVFQVSNGQDLITNVNDAQGGYGDNTGSYDLVVEVVQP
jgi:hypothetical protein